ncbi:putative WRKY transcription factor 14 [Apostasia shenzhenica]|uniref:Putative WRKY transcription factor 14 n=1 Tax=Apostasia shenzhenica TaxID=1088818 RepID=A0A2I0ACF0_9ASPA|nr:putative WRKY transcription factor 14 [Apostasia shenzhenica]
MCDCFWQRMENGQGDLADIVKASGLAGPPDHFPDFPSSAATSAASGSAWHFSPDPTPLFPANAFGDPFADVQDPLLHELAAGTGFFDSPEAPPPPEGKRSSSSLFSRMLQISPGKSLAPPMIGPQQAPVIVAAGDSPVDGGAGLLISSPRTTGIKRRKSQAKKVVCIPAPAAGNGRPSGEAVPSDLWAWRKYGQKPIKGSPYPRGYYRCSSSKGCSARKQVERSRTDPNMLVITYTSEHNHPWPTQRNALAGSTRSQPSKPAISNTSSSSSSSSCKITPHCSQKKPISSIKEEEDEGSKENCASSSSTKQAVKEELAFQPDDFFADLAELETDPMNLIFPAKFMGDKLINVERENTSKGMDPFNNLFDWGGEMINSFGEEEEEEEEQQQQGEDHKRGL